MGRIKSKKYFFYLLAGFGQVATLLLTFMRGDQIKQALQLLDLSSRSTYIALAWVLAAVIAFYAPLMARHYQGLLDRYRLTDPAFVADYRVILANAINDLEDVRDGRKDAESVELGLLRAMVSIVRYYQGVREEASINANLMLPRAPNDPMCKQIRFVESPDGLSKCPWVLKIERWAYTEPEIPNFCLPVYDPQGEWSNRILFGAPLAFVRKEPDVINNTKRVPRKKWASGVSPRVKAEVKQHFIGQRRVFRSFASLPAFTSPDAETLAVVNIQWNRKRVFGSTPGVVIDLLVPLVLLLAHVRRTLASLEGG